MSRKRVTPQSIALAHEALASLPAKEVTKLPRTGSAPKRNDSSDDHHEWTIRRLRAVLKEEYKLDVASIKKLAKEFGIVNPDGRKRDTYVAALSVLKHREAQEVLQETIQKEAEKAPQPEAPQPEAPQPEPEAPAPQAVFPAAPRLDAHLTELYC